MPDQGAQASGGGGHGLDPAVAEFRRLGYASILSRSDSDTSALASMTRPSPHGTPPPGPTRRPLADPLAGPIPTRTQAMLPTFAPGRAAPPLPPPSSAQLMIVTPCRRAAATRGTQTESSWKADSDGMSHLSPSHLSCQSKSILTNNYSLQVNL